MTKVSSVQENQIIRFLVFGFRVFFFVKIYLSLKDFYKSVNIIFSDNGDCSLVCVTLIFFLKNLDRNLYVFKGGRLVNFLR